MKYWAYVNNEILGPYEKEKLLELPSFSPSLLVCPQTPVGEKTEDWKEAATYPELSALLGSASSLSAPKAAAAPEAQPAGPAAEKPAAALKPMVSSSIEQAPPSSHGFNNVDIAVNSLGKAHGAEPAPAVSAPHQSSANFDPISLSQIVRRTEAAQPQEATPAVGEPLAKEPPSAFASSPLEDAKPAQETPAFKPAAQEFKPAADTPAFTPSAVPELETFSRPAASSYAQPDKGAMDALGQKLDALAKSAATKQDLSAAIDPFHLKLDQLGEVVASLKGSQYQREIMEKLAFLENSIAELKAGMRSAPAGAPAQAETPGQQDFKVERNSDTVFGAQTPPPQQKSAREAAQEAAAREPAKATAKPMEIVDQGGSKSSKIGAAVKKLFKFVITLALLAAVLLGAVIGLKQFGIFDATGFIPFPLPFVSAPAKQEPAPEPQPAAQPAQPAQPPQGAQAPAQPAAQEPDLSPQIIYFTRTYRANPAGPSLEDKMNENAALQGGDYGQVNWQVKQGGEGLFEIAAIVPAKGGKLTYTYIVDYNKKTILPSDESGKAAFDALTAAPKRVKGAGKGRKQQPPAKAAPKKAAPKAAAAPKAGKADDEYEYVYEEDDGTGDAK